MNKRKEARKKSLLPNGIPKYLRIYDNGGETIDRYTVVFTGRYGHKTGRQTWVLGMNGSPFHPQGFGQSSEYDHRIDCPTYSHLGKKIKFDDLPHDCQVLAFNTYIYLWDLDVPRMKPDTNY